MVRSGPQGSGGELWSAWSSTSCFSEATGELGGSDSLVMLRTDGGASSGVGMMAAAGLGRGERAPDMVMASRDGTPTRYYAHAGGRPALLVFVDEACVARLDALAEGLTAIG